MSKYRNKQKHEPKRVVRVGEPLFDYTSKCHGVKATKKPLVSNDGSEGTLGTWNCTACRRKCSVTRTKRKPEKEPASVAQASDHTLVAA